jgi:hypothetical protein
MAKNCLGLCILLSIFSCTPNPGVETGNPQIPTRKISGALDESTLINPVNLRRLAAPQLNLLEECADPSEIEARALDLSGVETADIIDHQFEISVDPEKVYTFVTKSGSTYCGILTFMPQNHGVCADPFRVVVGPSDEDIDLGTLQFDVYGSFQVETLPSLTLDTDNDGTVDVFDGDANGDDMADFDSNYDGFIDLTNSSETGSPDSCDLLNIASSGVDLTSLIGTVTTTNEVQTLGLTATQDILQLDISAMTLFNVDEGTQQDFSEVGSVTATSSEITLTLALDNDVDYVLIIPAGSLSCADDSTQEREITYYFRPVEYGLIYACGDTSSP